MSLIECFKKQKTENIIEVSFSTANLRARLKIPILPNKPQFHKLVSVEPLPRILPQNTIDENLEIRGDNPVMTVIHTGLIRIRVVHLVSNDPFQMFLLAYQEWRLPQKQFIGQNPNRPQVYLLIVSVADQNLRRQVQGSTTEGTSQLRVLQINRPPQVAKLDRPVSQNDVFRLNIPMQNHLPMHVAYPLQQVMDDIASPLLRHSLPFLHQLVKLPVAAHLHQHVNVLFIVENTV